MNGEEIGTMMPLLYRKIDVHTVHRDPRFTERSNKAKLSYLLGILHPDCTLMGTLVMPARRFARECLDDQADEVIAAWRELGEVGLLEWDEKVHLLVFPDIADHPPHNANRIVKQFPEAFMDLPDCALKERLRKRVLAALERLSADTKENLTETIKFFASKSRAFETPSPTPSKHRPSRRDDSTKTRNEVREDEPARTASSSSDQEGLALLVGAREGGSVKFTPKDLEFIDSFEQRLAPGGKGLKPGEQTDMFNLMVKRVRRARGVGVGLNNGDGKTYKSEGD